MVGVSGSSPPGRTNSKPYPTRLTRNLNHLLKNRWGKIGVRDPKTNFFLQYSNNFFASTAKTSYEKNVLFIFFIKHLNLKFFIITGLMIKITEN